MQAVADQVSDDPLLLNTQRNTLSLLIHHGWSQASLATRIGMQTSRVAEILRGNHSLRSITIKRISDALRELGWTCENDAEWWIQAPHLEFCRRFGLPPQSEE
jgi:transcriptional regulator with XRE-family HTH domain